VWMMMPLWFCLSYCDFFFQERKFQICNIVARLDTMLLRAHNLPFKTESLFPDCAPNLFSFIPGAQVPDLQQCRALGDHGLVHFWGPLPLQP